MTTATTPTTRQFTVRYLLLLTAIAAVCLLPVVQWGVPGIFPAVCFGSIGISLLHKRYVLAGGLFVLVAMCAILLPAISCARPSETVAVLESEVYRLHWMSTADPGIEMIGPTNADGETLLSHGPHDGFSVCACFDGHVQVLSHDLDFNDLLALTTIDDSESERKTD